MLVQLANPVAAEIKNEHKVKAAIVYKLLRYISWPDPASSSDTIRLCVDSNDPYYTAFSDLDGRHVRDQKIVLKVLPEPVVVDACHIAFTSAERDRTANSLIAQAGKGVLTVSDSSQFAEHGGMINLLVENNRVRFKINPQAAYKSDLRINSSLLRLAEVVETDSKPSKTAINLHVDSGAFE